MSENALKTLKVREIHKKRLKMRKKLKRVRKLFFRASRENALKKKVRTFFLRRFAPKMRKKKSALRAEIA